MFCDEQEIEADCIQNQYAAAIRLVHENSVWQRITSGVDGSEHDVMRAMHFAVLLHGRRPVGNVFTNAVNIGDSFRGPHWTRAADRFADRSIHAEARAAQRAFVPAIVQTRRARRKAERQSIGTADGLLVCRLNPAGKLRFSLPCEKCVQVLARCNFRFVVYSTGDPDTPWHKISLRRLQSDSRVAPASFLRRKR